MFGFWEVTVVVAVCLTVESIVSRICDTIENKRNNDIKY